MPLLKKSPSPPVLAAGAGCSSSVAQPLLTLTAIGIPPDAQSFFAYLSAARDLFEDFETNSNWKEESSHGVDARVASCKGDALGDIAKKHVDPREFWIGRRSEHNDIAWEDLLLLLKDEDKGSEWIKELKALEVISTYDSSSLPSDLHSGAIIHISQLDMPFPLSGRTFLSLVMTATPDEFEFINISVPVQDDAIPPGKGNENGRVRGRQVSVERVRRLQSGSFEWVCVTAFTLAGSVPQGRVDSKMTERAAGEIKAFVDWVHRK